MKPTRLFALALAVILAGLTSWSQARQEKDKSDKESLKGKWTVVKAEENGKASEDLPKAKFEFKDDKLSIKIVTSQDPADVTFTLNPNKSPKEIDIKPADSKEAAVGIYELSGDNLKLCVADPNNKRPTEFKSAMKTVYIELARDKEK